MGNVVREAISRKVSMTFAGTLQSNFFGLGRRSAFSANQTKPIYKTLFIKAHSVS